MSSMTDHLTVTFILADYQITLTTTAPLLFITPRIKLRTALWTVEGGRLRAAILIW